MVNLNIHLTTVGPDQFHRLSRERAHDRPGPENKCDPRVNAGLMERERPSTDGYE